MSGSMLEDGRVTLINLSKFLLPTLFKQIRMIFFKDVFKNVFINLTFISESKPQSKLVDQSDKLMFHFCILFKLCKNVRYESFLEFVFLLIPTNEKLKFKKRLVSVFAWCLQFRLKHLHSITKNTFKSSIFLIWELINSISITKKPCGAVRKGHDHLDA